MVHSLLDADVSNLDPIHSTNKYASIVNAAIFEGLYHYHFLKRPLELQPLLAQSMPKVSPDGTTYTIELKKGVFFQDDPAFANGKGRELVAEDFIYSWKRLADPKNRSLGWWLFDGMIQGLNEWRDLVRQGKADYNTPIPGLKSLNPHKIQIKLKQNLVQFTHRLAHPSAMVVAKEVVEKYGPEIVNHPVGTGPYTLSQWNRGSQIELHKNSNYRNSFYPKEGTPEDKKIGRLTTAGLPLPLNDRVVIHIIKERQPQWLSFLRGELDHGVIPKDNYDQVYKNDQISEEYLKKGIGVHFQYRPDVTFVAFNMDHPILGKNKKLRQAMAMAIDKKLILEKFYNNRGLVSQSLIPPNFPSYQADYTNPYSYNPERASKLMTEAGYPDGKGLTEFKLDLPSSSPWARQFGEVLKAQLENIGVRVKVIPNSYPQFDKKIKSRQSDLFNMGWNADYPDEENFLQLFYSGNVSPGPNNANFVNRDFDQLYQEILKLTGGEKRNKKIRQMIDIINEETPTIFMNHRVFRLPYHGWLKNYKEHPIIYDHLKYLQVDSNLKKQLKAKL